MTRVYMPQVRNQVAAARQFVDAWMQALGDRAAVMVEDKRLTQCAADHADYLANRPPETMQESMHIGRGGSVADNRVRESGYKLPEHWHGNHVESCACHHGSAGQAVAMLLDSPGHRVHMLGEGGFVGHTAWGVGAVPPFYVFLAAPKEG